MEEPQDGSTSVELPVIRRGGTSGVVTVSWEATLGGKLTFYTILKFFLN